MILYGHEFSFTSTCLLYIFLECEYISNVSPNLMKSLYAYTVLLDLKVYLFCKCYEILKGIRSIKISALICK